MYATQITTSYSDSAGVVSCGYASPATFFQGMRAWGFTTSLLGKGDCDGNPMSVPRAGLAMWLTVILLWLRHDIRVPTIQAQCTPKRYITSSDYVATHAVTVEAGKL